MRSTLLLPPRRSWPISAAVAGRAYEWKRRMPEIPPAVTAYRLPDGRYKLLTEGLIPVVISRALYAACTEHQRWAMVRLLAAHAVFFCTEKTCGSRGGPPASSSAGRSFSWKTRPTRTGMRGCGCPCAA
jgi:hypothetical protein